MSRTLKFRKPMLRGKPAVAISHVAQIDWSHGLHGRKAMVKRNEVLWMFGSFKTLIGSLVSDAGRQNRFEKDCLVATAALLIRMACVDGELSEAKRGKLHAVVKSNLGLDDLTSLQLIDDAVVADRSAIDLYHFTRQLSAVLDDEGRRRVVKMMWEVAYGDESVNEVSSNIIWRVADLLGVPSRQRIELRQRIAAERAVLAPV
jgi:uncharacterized tellurite resistance protein B-like protein